METIVGGRRSEEDLPRQELKNLSLDEAMRCLKASAPDVGSNYNKAITPAGNLLRQKKKRIPLFREAAIEIDRQIRVIMNVSPEEIAKMWTASEVSSAHGPKHQWRWMTAAHSP
jgi:hypothetical protein